MKYSVNLPQMQKLKKAQEFLQKSEDFDSIDKNNPQIAKIFQDGTDGKVCMNFWDFITEDCDGFREILGWCSSMELEVLNEDYFKLTLTIPNVYTEE